MSAGDSYGLNINLNVELEEYFNDEVAPAIGFKILIHEQNELPLVKENGFAVMPGATTFVSMKERKVRD